jgi:hypothetical protein
MTGVSPPCAHPRHAWELVVSAIGYLPSKQEV